MLNSPVPSELRGDTGTTGAEFSLLRLQIASYRRVATGLLVDSLWRYRGRAAWLWMLGILALLFQAVALVTLLEYTRGLETGQVFEIANFAANPRTSFNLLVVVLLVAGGALVAASFLRLWSEHGFYDLGRRYGLFCARRLVSLTTQALHDPQWKGKPFEESEVMHLVNRGSTICGRTLQRLLAVVPKLAGLLIFSTFLVYLDSSLALIILAVLLVSFYVFYRLSLTASQITREQGEMQGKAREERRALMDAMRFGMRPLKADDQLVVDTVDQGAFAKAFAASLRFQSLSIDSTHVNTLVQAFLIALIGLIKGSESITTGTGFGDMVVFLITGRIALDYFLGVTNTLVMINRFYLPVSGYFALVERLEGAASKKECRGQSGLRPVVIVAPPFGQAGPKARIEPGMRLAVVAPQSLDRFALSGLLAGLQISSGRSVSRDLRPVGRASPGLCWLVPPKLIRLGSFGISVGLPPDMDGHKLKSRLSAFGVGEDALNTLPDDPAAELDESAWNTIAPSALYGACLLAAATANHPILVVSSGRPYCSRRGRGA